MYLFIYVYVYIGSLCVIDSIPRYSFSIKDQQILFDFSVLVAKLIEEKDGKRSEHQQLQHEHQQLQHEHCKITTTGIETEFKKDIDRNYCNDIYSNNDIRNEVRKTSVCTADIHSVSQTTHALPQQCDDSGKKRSDEVKFVNIPMSTSDSNDDISTNSILQSDYEYEDNKQKHIQMDILQLFVRSYSLNDVSSYFKLVSLSTVTSSSIIDADTDYNTRLATAYLSSLLYIGSDTLEQFKDRSLSIKLSKQIIPWLQIESSKYNNIHAHFNLGFFLYWNIGVSDSYIGCTSDQSKAISLFHLAAEQGHVVAMHELGVCYQFGFGTNCNLNESFRYYKLSADLHYAPSIYDLACCYSTGQGVHKNTSIEVKCLQLAASMHYVRGLYALGQLYEEGSEEVSKDLSRAFACYRLASQQNYRYAILKMLCFSADYPAVYLCEVRWERRRRALWLTSFLARNNNNNNSCNINSNNRNILSAVSTDIAREIVRFL